VTGPLDGVPVAILTLSDTVARGAGADTSGDVIADVLTGLGAMIVRRDVLTDDREAISARLIEYVDRDGAALVLTTGGSGFSPRDVTPEATLAVVDRLAPGLVEAARVQTSAKSPLAMMSRAVAGTRGRCLIVNLPGSPKAVREWLDVLAPVFKHAVRLLKGDAPQWGRDHSADALPPC